MKKLDMMSKDVQKEKIELLKELLPDVVVESAEGEYSIDVDALKQEINDKVVDNAKEKFQLIWPGKKEAILEVNKKVNKSLRPCKEKSVDYENTKNVYIEGDNLEALKILQESYLGKIKCIYIDPPYNTGNDFVYNDNFSKMQDEELEKSGQVDEYNNRLITNSQSNGRFHSDWLSMMYSRLKIARNLLTDDGVMFISIGDEEYNLTRLCNEIFGEYNHITNISRLMKSGGNKGKFFSPNIDYILVYAKNLEKVAPFSEELGQDLIDKVYNKVDENGKKYREMGLYQPGLDKRPNQRYYIECPDGSLVIPSGASFPLNNKEGEKILPKDGDGVWRWIPERFFAEKEKGNIIFKETKTSSLIDENGKKSKWNIYTKIMLEDREESGRIPTNFIGEFENRISSAELKELDIPFDFAKPVGLIKKIINYLSSGKDDIILDFFSGSATTAHAVMSLNAADNGSRKYIMVQLPEFCDENSEAFRNGYKTLCDIGEERIRRAGKKIKEETNADMDYGFRVYKVDSSCMKDVYYEPNKIKQDQLGLLESNIKEDRNPEDLLTQVILDLGLTLDLKIEEKEVLGNKVFFVEDNALVACFDDNINEDLIDEIAKVMPLKVVLRDGSFGNDSAKINFMEGKIKEVSPDTEICVL